MTRKSGLGKGLDALIPSAPEDSALPASGIALVQVQQIIPNPQQPRTKFDEGELSELAASIQEHGVIQPLVITSGGQADQYILIAGERRLQAAKLAGLRAVPVIIREASNQELLELALIENLQRADLSPLETADAYKRLQEEYKLTQEQVAERVGKSRVAVTNTLRLLDLSDAVKQALAENQISEGHARALHGLSAQAQKAALAAVIERGLNVRQAEELARKYKGEKVKATKKKPKMAPEILDLQNRLRDSLQTEVKLTHGPKGGTMTVRYYSDEELNELVDKLIGDEK
jgi:ParB family chromosome partitioning protein